MRLRKLNYYIISILLLFLTSIFLFSCTGCGGVNKGNNSFDEKTSNTTNIENIENIEQSNIQQETSSQDHNSFKLFLEDSLLVLKSDKNNIIFKKELSQVNPFLKKLELNQENYDKISGLYLIGNEVKKDKFKSVFSDNVLFEIPNEYSCNYIRIGSPILSTNGFDKFAASFIAEWGKGLLNENSLGEYQSSSIYIWNEKGRLMDSLNLDFGAHPYITKNGKYMWLKYGELNNISTSDDFEMTSCMSLYNIDEKRVIFKKKFYSKEVIVGGYNNSKKYFGFTVFKDKKHYTIYYLDEVNNILYSKEMESNVNYDNLTIEGDFAKINLQKL